MKRLKKAVSSLLSVAIFCTSIAGLTVQAADTGVLLTKDFTTMTGAPANAGWVPAKDTGANGTSSFTENGLTLVKTAAANAGEYAMKMPLTHTLRDYDAENLDSNLSRTSTWTNQVKGIFDVEYQTAGSGDSWMDFPGRNNKTSGNSCARLVTQTASKIFSVYSTANINNGNTGSYSKLLPDSIPNKVKVRFNTTTAKFQVFINDSTEAAKSDFNCTDFVMTDWGARTNADYVDHIQIGIAKPAAKDTTVSLKNVSVTQVTDGADGKAEDAEALLTMDKVCQDPTNVVAINTLPTAIDGVDGLDAITWTSSKPSVIDPATGTVLQGANAEDVILTAKLTDTDTQYTINKTFKLTVPATENVNTPELILARAKAYMDTYKVTDENYDNITKHLTLTHSLTDESSGEEVGIIWTSSKDTVIGNDGTYKAGEKPSESSNITMTATMSVTGSDLTATSTYNLKVQAYSDEVLIDSENFQNKTVVDNTVAGWEFYDKTIPVEKLPNIALSLANNKLTIKKTGDADETDYSERYRSMYRFKDYVRPYSADTNSATYKTNLRGKYKVVTTITPHVQSGSQFQVPMVAIGDAGTAPIIPYPVSIDAGSSVYEYIDSTTKPTIYGKGVNDKETTLTFIVDTETGKVTTTVNADGTEYTSTKYEASMKATTLQGMVYTLKSRAKINDSTTVNDIKLYRIEGIDDGSSELLASADTLLVNQITDTPNAIVSDLKELPKKAGDADVTWKSSNPNLLNADTGILGERPLTGDVSVILTAQIKKGSVVLYKDFHLTVKQENDPDALLAKAAAALTYKTLTDEDTENVSKNLKSLPATGLFGTTIVWKSSDPTVMSDKGEVLQLGQYSKLPVTMTATISLGGKDVTKAFDIQIAIDFSAGLIELFKTDFTGTQMADNITPINGAGSVKQENGKLTLTRNTTGGNQTSVQIYPTLNGKKANITGEMIVEVDINMLKGATPDLNCQKGEIVLFDTEGRRITTFYTTSAGKGPKSFTGVYRDALDGEAIHKATNVTENAGLPLKVKIHTNLDTKRISLYADTGAGYKTIAENKFIREDATSLSYISINSVDDTNGGKTFVNKGVLDVNSVNLAVNEGSIPNIVANNVDYFSSVLALGGYVANSVALNAQAFPGTTVKWTSSRPDILSDTGVFNRNNVTKDEDLVLSFHLSLDSNPSQIFYHRDFNLKAIYIKEGNLSLNKPATSDVIANAGFSAAKAVDGMMFSSWQTMRSDKTPSLTIDLQSKEVVTEVLLSEAKVLDVYPIKGYVIETSVDNKKWTTFASGTTLGETAKTHTGKGVVARYVRYRVTSKDDGNSGLNEIQVILSSAGTTKLEADLTLLADTLGSLKGLTKSVTLPKTGHYGSTFTYTSSISTNFANDGTVKRPESTVYGTLEIEASADGKTSKKELPISVTGTNNGGGNTSGGGGSTGGTTGNNSFNNSTTTGPMPAFPQTPPTIDKPQDNSVFGDVNTSRWSYAYIKTLKDKSVISGDANGNFRPTDSISREEFVKMLIGVLGVGTSTEANLTFTDVSTSDWSYAYIAKAVELGLINGVSDSEFGKSAPITRQDIAVMCARALKVLNKTGDSSELTFADSDAVSNYAKENVSMMVNLKIINGYEDNTFRPQNNASREEAAKILCELTK